MSLIEAIGDIAAALKVPTADITAIKYVSAHNRFRFFYQLNHSEVWKYFAFDQITDFDAK